MSDKTGRINFLRARHTEHLSISDMLYRDDELSGYSAVVESLNFTCFFYAQERAAWNGETVYVYYGVFYDMDLTLDIDMTSMRVHLLISVCRDVWHGDKLESAIDALIADDTNYRMSRA